MTERFVEELSLLEPFGKGNTKPVFAARNVEILSGRILGKNKNVLKLCVRDAAGTVIDAMCFQQMEGLLRMLRERYGEQAVREMLDGKQSRMTFSITYYPDINEYMGKATPQITITHYK